MKDKINKKYISIFVCLIVLLIIAFFGYYITNQNQEKQTADNIKEVELKEISAKVLLDQENDNIKIYSFAPGNNFIDLNFDGFDDNVFVSHIVGADYYDYHTNANTDIYNFFIQKDNSWNIVTKEDKNKKILEFERDFLISEIMGCNGGKVLKIAQTNNQTFLIIVKNNNKAIDQSKTTAIFSIYELKESGELRGSDYIFVFIKDVFGSISGCGIDDLSNQEILETIEKISTTNNKNLTYNDVINSKIETIDNKDYYQSSLKDSLISWQGKISAYYSQITGIKFCIIDDYHQEVDINNPCDWFWAFADELIGADDLTKNPNWDGKWVNYILNYYEVPFDKNGLFYNDVYTIRGKINGIDCAIGNKCVPDIEIINITK